MNSYVGALKGIDTSDLPDIHTLTETRLQIFWTLAAAEKLPQPNALSANDISEILRDLCGIAISRQKVAAILLREKNCVSRVGRLKPAKFRLMKKGVDELQGVGFRPYFIDPERALSSIRKVEEIFSNLKGDIRIVDTYIDNRTLDYIALSTSASEIKILTENIQDSNRLKRNLAAFKKQYGIDLEIRQAPSGHLHDRYIIFDEGMFILGCSIKDISKKQSIIVALSRNIASEIVRAFERIWSRSTKFQ